MLGQTRCPWHAQQRGPGGSVSIGKADILRWWLAACAATRMGGIWITDYEVQYTKAIR